MSNPIDWFHHAKARANFWADPSRNDTAMVALWEREMQMAYFKLTPAERARL